LASAASFPGMPACPAIQWMVVGIEVELSSISLRMWLAITGYCRDRQYS
jgi:hypothetical protein